MSPPIFIAIPAWGKYFVDIAVRFTVPAVLASLSESGFQDVTFLIYTDNPSAFGPLLGTRARYFTVRASASWPEFIQAHQQAINLTQRGAVLALLNADIVVSREAFAFAESRFNSDDRAHVIASTGIRTLSDEGPPIGVDAATLNAWCWQHRHPLTEESIWGRGRTQKPTVVFFEDGDSVSLHCFHLCPMFIRKDRTISIRSTIDVGMLGHYNEKEIVVVRNQEMAFAEISPASKTHPNSEPLSVESVVERGHRRFNRHTVANFKHRISVIGNPQRNHPAADEIIARLPRL